MSEWFQIKTGENEDTITFDPKNPGRFWSPDVLRERPLSTQGLAGRRVVLTGAGANWMYAHAGTMLGAVSATFEVRTPHTPGESDDLTGSDCRFTSTTDGQAALLSIHLRKTPALSANAIDQLLQPGLEKLAQSRPLELCVNGQANVEVYAQVGWHAAAAGVRRMSCFSARDGLVIVAEDNGNTGSLPDWPNWLTELIPTPRQPVVIGVVGDPNRGKSVFRSVLEGYREGVEHDGWSLDCDGQSPTQDWYLRKLKEDLREATRLREEQKRAWTPEMEAQIANQIRTGRRVFEELIADLPGGNHAVHPPQRVPPGRERIFAEIDALILLDRAEGLSEQAWREALRPHGLEGRIAAVLMSRDPASRPSLCVRKESNLWRGEVTGLDRSRSAKELAEAFQSGFHQLWPALLEFARREPPPT